MLLSAEKLTKKFNSHFAVDELTLRIQNNECVALLGPNGSGKTTTLNMLSGLLTPTSGTIAFLGKSTINRYAIGYLPQYPSFFSWMTAKEYLYFVGSLSKVLKKDLAKKSEEMLYFVGLEEAKNKRIGSFSGGMKQRLGLAQAMLHEPKLLILDEPVSALDPAGRRDVLQMMIELKKKMAILFSTHVLHDAEQVCDDIVMLKEGKMKWSGPLHALKSNEKEETLLLSTEEKLGEWIMTKEYVEEFVVISATVAEVKLKNFSDSNRLLEDCLKHNMRITHFEVKKHSLEDTYMEVMNQ